MRKVFVGLGAMIVLGFAIWTSAGHIKTTQAAVPCIVTIFGQQYDVAPLGVTHPGPKGTTLIDLGGSTFFQCGTDMTATYQSQHGTDVSRMAPYIYVAPTPTAVPTATPTPSTEPTISPSPSITPSVSPTPEQEHEDEHEELEHEDKDELHESENAKIHENDEHDKVRNENHVNLSVNNSIKVKHDEKDND